jgi:hypothetical protein
MANTSDTAIVVPPAVAVTVGLLQSAAMANGVAITMPVGNVSLKLMPEMVEKPLGRTIVHLKFAFSPTPPTELLAVLRMVLVNVGFAVTVNVVSTTLLVTRARLENLAAVLVYVPTTRLVTGTEIVHVACPALIDAPVTVMLLAPPVAATAPTPLGQVDAILGDAATVTPVGKLLVKLMPLCAGLPAPLVKVKVKVEVSP